MMAVPQNSTLPFNDFSLISTQFESIDFLYCHLLTCFFLFSSINIGKTASADFLKFDELIKE